jgi:hypothetical protein
MNSNSQRRARSHAKASSSTPKRTRQPARTARPNGVMIGATSQSDRATTSVAPVTERPAKRRPRHRTLPVDENALAATQPGPI